MIWSLVHYILRADSIMYELQDERGKPSLVEPESNNESHEGHLLDVCVRFPFEASCYDHIAQVAVQHTGPPCSTMMRLGIITFSYSFCVDLP